MSEENKTISAKEAYEQRKKERERRRALAASAAKTKKKLRSAKRAALAVGAVAAAGYAVWFLISLIPVMPPTSPQGHSEESPPSHILTEPMPERIQRHMLEHADGGTPQGGVPGVIIQYNCGKYECAPDLIANLERVVRDYPENVYLAPSEYDGKIILTRIGQKEVLDAFDEEKIRAFIEGR